MVFTDFSQLKLSGKRKKGGIKSPRTLENKGLQKNFKKVLTMFLRCAIV